MKESGEDRLKCAVYESTRAPLARSPFPDGEGKEEAASPQKKKSQPRLAALGSPFQGKGLAWTPSFLWKEVPRRGRRLDGDAAIPCCDP